MHILSRSMSHGVAGEHRDWSQNSTRETLFPATYRSRPSEKIGASPWLRDGERQI